MTRSFFAQRLSFWFLICFGLPLFGCATSGSVAPHRTYADLAPPAKKLAIKYDYSYSNTYACASYNGYKFGEAVRSTFEKSGFFAASNKDRPADYTMTLKLEENCMDTKFGAFITGITFTLIPGPVQRYDYTLLVIVRKGEEIVKSYTYKDYSRLWFGLFCLPGLFTGSVHKTAAEVNENLLLNVLADVQKDAWFVQARR